MARPKRSKPAPKTTYWFKAKKYGWGWYPATWQGWAVIALYLIIVSLNYSRIESRSESVSETMLSYIPETFILTLLLIYICMKKGEWPRWRWGK